MELTIDELYSYLNCPLKYKLTYLDEIPDKSDYKNAVFFSKGIHRVISYFYYEVMQGRMPTLRQMRDKWASYYYEIFEDDVRTKDNFLTPRTKNDNQRLHQLLNRGYEAVYAFYAEKKDNPGTPIAVNYPYRVVFNDNLIIKGEFELIREVKDSKTQTRYIEIVDFKTSGYTKDTTDSFFLRHDMRATIMHEAFKEVFKQEPDRFVFDYVGSSNQIIIPRNDNETNRLNAILKGVGNGLKNQDYYPRQNFMCKNCSMKDYCDRLKF